MIREVNKSDHLIVLGSNDGSTACGGVRGCRGGCSHLVKVSGPGRKRKKAVLEKCHCTMRGNTSCVFRASSSNRALPRRF